MAIVVDKSWQCTNAEYHSDHSAVSHSSLEIFRRNSLEYYQRFVSHEIPKPDPTPAMIFGSFVHTFVLEPDLFSEQYEVLPPAPDGKWDKRTSEYKQAVKFYAVEGKTLIEAETYTRLFCIRRAIQDHPKAGPIMERCSQREITIRWTDPTTGLSCKCRCDALGDFVADIKTSDDISVDGFKKSCLNFGYARQAQFYQDGVLKASGEALPHVFVCVTKEAPYECAVHCIGPRSMELGARQNIQDLARLLNCQTSNDWRNDWNKGVNEIELPNYAFYEMEN